MHKAIILHGMPDKDEYMSMDYPSASNSHWLPWLQKALLTKGIEAHTPEVKDSYEPTYEKWLNALKPYELDKQTALVGHSCGAGFIVRYLSENPSVRLHSVYLVAPWLNPSIEFIVETDMFEFEIDPTIASCAKYFVVINSKDDFVDITKSTEMIMEKVKGAELVEFKDKGHFTYEDLGTQEFPELLEMMMGNMG